jgi:hypothetical protein
MATPASSACPPAMQPAVGDISASCNTSATPAILIDYVITERYRIQGSKASVQKRPQWVETAQLGCGCALVQRQTGSTAFVFALVQ